MDIVLNQTYEIENLITLSGNFTTIEFQSEIMNITNKYKNYSINNGDYIITTTKSIEFVKGEQIMSVEIFLPLSSCLDSNGPYIIKNKLKITNALYTKIEDINRLQEGLNNVNKYIIDNRYQPITNAYLIQTKKNNKSIIEIYIGLNPNII